MDRAVVFAPKGHPARQTADSLLVQRKCACGRETSHPSGECDECKRKRRLQTKARIGPPSDELEHEADRVADAILGVGALPAPRILSGETPLQHKTADGTVGLEEVPPIVHEVLRSPGQPLETGARAFMEQRFGHDFGRVRVHADESASESARLVGARAYAVGHDVVFRAGQYQPSSVEGRRMLAHELTHVLQQSAGGDQLRQPAERGPDRAPIRIQHRPGVQFLARQCDPVWASLPWSQRVANVRGMANGHARNQCFTDMIDEALPATIRVEEHTNSSPTFDTAIDAGRYVEMGTLSDLHVSFDQNLNAKTGDPGLWGETGFRTPAGNKSIRIFIVLGPQALDPVGPQHTQMAFEHENEHASDFLLQFVMIGSAPHAATSGEELRIHTEGFSRFFLDIWTINNSPPGRFGFSNDFHAIFTNYAASGTTQAQRDSAFDSMKMFFDVRISAIPCNMMKFKIWLQTMQNLRPGGDGLVARLNALPGLGLARGTNPATHLNTGLGCT